MDQLHTGEGGRGMVWMVVTDYLYVLRKEETRGIPQIGVRRQRDCLYTHVEGRPAYGGF